mgnify:CR=1 FL=1|tara:strand:+ start:51 stop:272 length:222 start_codon:yes stop_codon:yes gene_type:complete
MEFKVKKKFTKLTKKEKDIIDVALDVLNAEMSIDENFDAYNKSQRSTLFKLLNKIGHRELYIESLEQKNDYGV